jgi:hypothetical protein
MDLVLAGLPSKAIAADLGIRAHSRKSPRRLHQKDRRQIAAGVRSPGYERPSRELDAAKRVSSSSGHD